MEDAEIVTLDDVLETEEELMADAYAVLGGSDDSNCTYSQVEQNFYYFSN